MSTRRKTKPGAGNDLTEIASFTFRKQDRERLSVLAEILGGGKSATIRQCLPDGPVIRIFHALRAANRGLNYRDCVQQVFQEWLADRAPACPLPTMLEGLRSADSATRIRSGKLLSQSVEFGHLVEGPNHLKELHTLAPNLSKLIEKSVAGDAAATEHLTLILEKPPEPSVPIKTKNEEQSS